MFDHQGFHALEQLSDQILASTLSTTKTRRIGVDLLPWRLPTWRCVDSLPIGWRGWGSAAFIRRLLEKVVEIDPRRWRCQCGGPGGCESD
jgi:hypothetical protein